MMMPQHRWYAVRSQRFRDWGVRRGLTNLYGCTVRMITLRNGPHDANHEQWCLLVLG